MEATGSDDVGVCIFKYEESLQLWVEKEEAVKQRIQHRMLLCLEFYFISESVNCCFGTGSHTVVRWPGYHWWFKLILTLQQSSCLSFPSAKECGPPFLTEFGDLEVLSIQG